MDAEPCLRERHPRLCRVEERVQRQRPAILLPAKPMPNHVQGAAGGDAQAVHLHGVPKQLPLDPGPHRRRILVLKTTCRFVCFLYNFLNEKG